VASLRKKDALELLKKEANMLNFLKVLSHQAALSRSCFEIVGV
jgi:hypothetical protein